MRLRNYQAEALSAVTEAHLTGVAGQIINIPTSAGKTVIASSMATQTSGRKLFIVQAEELCFQAQEKFQLINPDLVVGVEKADRHADLARHDIVVASIQSLSRKKRLERFPRNSFTQIGIDECHHTSTTGMYADVLRWFRALKSEPDFDPSTLLYGLTATTERADGVGLEHSYSQITYRKSMLDLMRDGIRVNGKLYPFIADISCVRVDTIVDLSSVRTKGGDFDEADLVNLIDTPKRNKLVADAYLKHGEGMGSFAFTVNIAHSCHLAEEFLAQGIPAAVMQGATPREERKRLFAALREGSLKVIFSTAVLGEGIDQPQVGTGLMIRPTKSALLYRQQLGRLIRPFPAPEEVMRRHLAGEPIGWRKEHAKIIDFADQSGRHRLIETPSLFGLRNTFDMKGDSALKVMDEIEEIERKTSLDVRGKDSIYEIRSLIEQVDLLKAPVTPPEIRAWSKYAWLEAGPGKYSLGLHGNRSLRVARNEHGSFEVSTYTNGIKVVRRLETTLRMAIEAAEWLIPTSEARTLKEDAAWHHEPPTKQQCGYLFTLDHRNLSRAHADGHAFWLFAKGEYYCGNNDFSCGGIAKMISSKKLARPVWLQQKIAANSKRHAGAN